MHGPSAPATGQAPIISLSTYDIAAMLGISTDVVAQWLNRNPELRAAKRAPRRIGCWTEAELLRFVIFAALADTFDHKRAVRIARLVAATEEEHVRVHWDAGTHCHILTPPGMTPDMVITIPRQQTLTVLRNAIAVWTENEEAA